MKRTFDKMASINFAQIDLKFRVKFRTDTIETYNYIYVYCNMLKTQNRKQYITALGHENKECFRSHDIDSRGEADMRGSFLVAEASILFFCTPGQRDNFNESEKSITADCMHFFGVQIKSKKIHEV